MTNLEKSQGLVSRDRGAHFERVAAAGFSKKRGFATFAATAMIILLGTALVAFSALFATDALRTKMQRSQAQLRQLLTASAALAPQYLDAGQTDIELPQTFAGLAASLSLTAESAGSDRRTVQVIARLDERQAEQVLQFQRTPAGWQLVEARLLRQW